VGSPWHEQNWIGSKKYVGVAGMADTWKRAPIVFEWFGNYDYLQSRQWSFDAAVNFMLSNHVSLINDNIGRVPPEAMPQLEKLARLAGARFVLREIAHEKVLRRGKDLDLQMTWANVGVARLLRPYVLQWSLLDQVGQPAFTAVSKADPRDWLPGEHRVTEAMLLPTSLKPGTYTLALTLLPPTGQARSFHLAMDAPQQTGRYAVSTIELE
jgi:hypothetical protein